MTPANNRILRQYGKKLMQPTAYLALFDDAHFGLYREGQKAGKPRVKIETVHVEAWQKADLLHGAQKLYLSEVGRAFLRRQQSDTGVSAFLEQHKLTEAAAHDASLRQTQTAPLQWLKARKQDKRFGLRDVDFEAGEMLAQIYDRAAFHPRQTMNWQRTVFVDGISSFAAVDAPSHVLDARRKLNAALDYVGPGLSDVALAVCCAEVGLEECERGFALPKRSGKLMLKMALTRLSVFYGLQTADAAAASLRMRATME